MEDRRKDDHQLHRRVTMDVADRSRTAQIEHERGLGAGRAQHRPAQRVHRRLRRAASSAGTGSWRTPGSSSGCTCRTGLQPQGRRVRRAPRHARRARSSTRRPGRRRSATTCPRPDDRARVAELMVPHYERRRVRRLDLPAVGRHQLAAGRLRLRPVLTRPESPGDGFRHPATPLSRGRQRGDRRHRSRSARAHPAPEAGLFNAADWLVDPARRWRRRTAGRSPRSTSTAASRTLSYGELDERGPPLRRGPDRVRGPPGGAAAAVHGRHPGAADGVPRRPADRRGAGAGEHDAQAEGHRRAGRATAGPGCWRSARSSPRWRPAVGGLPELADVVVVDLRRRCPRSPRTRVRDWDAFVAAGADFLEQAAVPYPTIADSPALLALHLRHDRHAEGRDAPARLAARHRRDLRPTCWRSARTTSRFSVAKFFFAYGLGNTLLFPFSVGAPHGARPVAAQPGAARCAIARRSTRPTLFFGGPTSSPALLRAGLPADALAGVRACVSAGEAFPAALLRAVHGDVRRRDPRRHRHDRDAAHLHLQPARAGSGRAPRARRARLRRADRRTTTGSRSPTAPRAPVRPGQLGGHRLLVPQRGHPAGVPGRVAAHRRHLRPRRGRLLHLPRPHRRHAQGRRHLGLPDRGRGAAARSTRTSPRSSWSPRARRRRAGEAGRLRRPHARARPRPRTSWSTFCREGLAAFKRPRHVLVFDELPTTATGKLQRFRIRELAVERLGSAAPDLTPTTEAPHDRDRHLAPRDGHRRWTARRRRPPGRRRRPGRASTPPTTPASAGSGRRSSTACPSRAAR